MFAETTEIAEKNMKTITKLASQADLRKAPDFDILPSFKMEKSQFLEQWNKIAEHNWIVTNIHASLIVSSILSKLDFSFEEFENLAIKLHK